MVGDRGRSAMAVELALVELALSTAGMS